MYLKTGTIMTKSQTGKHKSHVYLQVLVYVPGCCLAIIDTLHSGLSNTSNVPTTEHSWSGSSHSVGINLWQAPPVQLNGSKGWLDCEGAKTTLNYTFSLTLPSSNCGDTFNCIHIFHSFTYAITCITLSSNHKIKREDLLSLSESPEPKAEMM